MAFLACVKHASRLQDSRRSIALFTSEWYYWTDLLVGNVLHFTIELRRFSAVDREGLAEEGRAGGQIPPMKEARLYKTL